MKKNLLILFFVFLAIIPPVISTTLTLIAPDSENLDDTWIQQGSAAADRGTSASFRLFAESAAADFAEIVLKFNISALPSPITIYSANLSLYLISNRLEGTESYSGAVHHIYPYPTYTPNASGEWTEGDQNNVAGCVAPEMCWNNQPTSNEYNTTAESSITFDSGSAAAQYYDWAVLNMVRAAYAQGDANISIWVRATHISGNINANNDYSEFPSKEDSTTTIRPKLTIDYDGPPTFSNAWNSSPSYKNKNTTFNITITDARDNIENATFFWNESGSWESKYTETGISVPGYNFSVSLNITTRVRDEIFYWLVQSCDEQGNCANSSSYLVSMSNTAPTHSIPILNATNPTNATSANLTCYNQSTNDIDRDSVTNIYKWYKNDIIQPGFENSTYINSTDTNKNDVWLCEITPFDSYDYGISLNSSNLTIKNFPPKINSNTTVPAFPTENEIVYIYANVTDVDGNDDIEWVNFTVTAPNGTIIIDNENASSNIGDIWNSSTFTASSLGIWNWNISAFDGGKATTTSGSFTIFSGHILVGNLSGEWALQDLIGSSLINWDVTNASGSNIYVADSDSSLSFSDFKAFSRNISGTYFSNDFEEIDILLNTTDLADSINLTYTSNGNPKKTSSFTIFGNTINNVPIINSTNNSNFITGILWDSSDDSGDGQFDKTDKEDIVFITQVNFTAQGKYGFYDYEIWIPASLRKYITGDILSVSIYAEIR